MPHLQSLSVWIQGSFNLQQGDVATTTSYTLYIRALDSALGRWSPSLTSLALYNIPITQDLLQILCQLKHLRCLRLPNANLDGTLSRTLCQCLPNISKLYIAGNLSLSHLDILGLNLTMLKCLDIRRTQISVEHIQQCVFRPTNERGENQGYFPYLRKLWISPARTFSARALSELRETARTTRPQCDINPPQTPGYQ